MTVLILTSILVSISFNHYILYIYRNFKKKDEKDENYAIKIPRRWGRR